MDLSEELSVGGNDPTLANVLELLNRIGSRHQGKPEDLTFYISEWAGITYQRWETDEEEQKREAEEASAKHKQLVQYLKLREEFGDYVST